MENLCTRKLLIMALLIFALAFFCTGSQDVLAQTSETTTVSDDITNKYNAIDYDIHNCSELQNAQPIIGYEIINNVGHCVIGKVENGEITGVDKVLSTLETGNYYLAKDIVVIKPIHIAKYQDVSLCLNAKTISKGNISEKFSIIEVYGTLNLYDCTSKGKITGGSAEHGGAIRGGVGSYIKMYGGNIIDNTALYGGGGIYSSGMVYIYGGNITNNTAPTGGGIFSTTTLSIEKESPYSTRVITLSNNSATVSGGAIYCYGNTYLYAGTIEQNYAPKGGGVHYTGSELRFGGTPKITGNETKSDGGTLSNVFIPDDKYATVSKGMFSSLREGADIGITKEGTFGKIVETSIDLSEYFKSDESHEVKLEDGYLWIAEIYEDPAPMIKVSKLIDSLSYDNSSVYDILCVEEEFNKLSTHLQGKLDSASKNKLDEFVNVAKNVYNGDLASMKQNGEFKGYFGSGDYDTNYIVGKIYNLASFKYVLGSLPKDESLNTIEEINKELVEIIYGNGAKIEYNFDINEEVYTDGMFSAKFFNDHHIFPIGKNFYLVHDELDNRAQTAENAGFWDFGITKETTNKISGLVYPDNFVSPHFEYETYETAMLTNEQKLIENSVGKEYDYLVSLFTRLSEAHVTANNMPKDPLGDCDGTGHTEAEHYESVEIAKMALERLSKDERALLGDDLKRINTQYEALIKHMSMHELHQVNYIAQGLKGDGVHVFGLATQLDLSNIGVNSGLDKINVYVTAEELSQVNGDNSANHENLSDNKVLTAYNLKMHAKTELGTTEVQPADGKKVVVVMPVPNDTLFSEVELYHVKYENDIVNGVERITDWTYFVDMDKKQTYLSFPTKSFSGFIMTGKNDPEYVNPFPTTSGSGGFTPPLNVSGGSSSGTTDGDKVEPTTKPEVTQKPTTKPQIQDDKEDVQITPTPQSGDNNKDQSSTWIYLVCGGAVALLAVLLIIIFIGNKRR